MMWTVVTFKQSAIIHIKLLQMLAQLVYKTKDNSLIFLLMAPIAK